MKSKTKSRSKIIKEADKRFSIYIRLSDCDKNGIVVCPLCGAKNHWKLSQNMHFISRACMRYRYDEKNCYAGCKRCNVMLNGNYIAYTRFMQKRLGITVVDEMIFNSKQTYKLTTGTIEEIAEHYKKCSYELAETKGIEL